MKQSICAFLICALLTVGAYAVSDAPETSADAVAVMHVETGRMLCAENADTPMRIASTTKIMTALVVIERCDLEEPVTIRPEDVDVEGSRMYCSPGETYTVRELLYGLMLASGNDAALALARHACGSVAAFAAAMNDKAAALGLQQTHFCNPHGLDAEGHQSTARELAVLACAAMQNETFCEIVSTYDITINNKTYVNHNKLLRTYDGAIGVKTGYTEAAGRILVSCAERNGMRVVCVTISDPDDWADHASLLDWAFERWSYRALAVSYVVPVVSGAGESCRAVPAHPVRVLLTAGERPSLRPALPRFVFAPVRAGQSLGTLTITAPDGTETQTPLVSDAIVSVNAALRLTPGERLMRTWRLLGHGMFTFRMT